MANPRKLSPVVFAVAAILAGPRRPAEAGARPRVVYFSQNVGGGHDTVPLGFDGRIREVKAPRRPALVARATQSP